MINASSAPSDPSDATPAAIEVALLQSWLASSSALQSCSCKRQLDQFRSTQPRRTKLPESLWQAAVELARQHGVYSVAHPLRLDYVGLKKRLGGASTRRRKATKPAFVELIGPNRAQPEECVTD